MEETMSTVTTNDRKIALERRFHELAAKWRSECLLISSTEDMAMHAAYQQIIGMGPDAIPILLEEMQREPDHWSWALRAITGDNPVRPEHRGKIALIAQDWIEWGKEHGYLSA
jgi:hypothetical protein